MHDKSWSPILFEVKRLNVKVTGSTVVVATNKLQTRSLEGATVAVMIGILILEGRVDDVDRTRIRHSYHPNYVTVSYAWSWAEDNSAV